MIRAATRAVIRAVIRIETCTVMRVGVCTVVRVGICIGICVGIRVGGAGGRGAEDGAVDAVAVEGAGTAGLAVRKERIRCVAA